MSKAKWIQKAHIKKGGLHKSLGIKGDKKIPLHAIEKAAQAGGKLGKQANLALTFREMKKK